MSEQIIAIIGGGQAAAMAAAALRQRGFHGTLHLFSDEMHLPYERPPLSKAMLLDENPQLQPVLPANWWQDNNVQLHLGVTIRQLDRVSHTLTLTDGQTYRWTQLLFATGAAARPLPLLDALGERCLTLRHAGDAERLRQVLQPGKSLVIVGAGTIGLELAASAIQRGCQVTVVEQAATVMGRNAPPPVRDYLLARHQQAGVRVLLNCAIEHALAGERLLLTPQNGETLSADAVVYGIGIVANDALARDAGLETDNGIIVDSTCTTSDPAIFAAGDVALVRQPDGALRRVESWENANLQAQTAAASMLGQPLTAAAAGWFWTDQYRDNLQFVGDMQGDAWQLRGSPEQGKAIWFNLRDGALAGAVTLNNGREVRVLRKLIQSSRPVSADALCDETVALKSL
ncbi:phenylpropionate dioxygenase ferredoxin reductase subunit [Kluyvera cryocrescens]|uniref:phenylpropionate dioxygenase ferredoxin reductase subunit n=1 Tax=Kluyvera cryocrescens TaxID=580 RepID=UPI001A1AE9EC|nr:phenylpropionate dioxygenase ferredoxin reductase subunit [Kluyvera cryocrescens]MEB6633580.1 phenylpropionate dioxygenase ferredoxin reductase subunit [Kluyvera cryocrescens]MEB7557980.1 phenylpropionate dioxygenase ferredoxin reductase subunit [Kluyvera cryocrescens]HAT1572245.1 phenylpropionate dioxygenase ferredoxin reductase subunit [Kluyvera cryocrescens]HDG1671965.1 phenylpropionate dioxygenase ferredoxin reductase subunit [Kluyvera cryocrescens]HDG1685774.1 phenylpropionate dioxygen